MASRRSALLVAGLLLTGACTGPGTPAPAVTPSTGSAPAVARGAAASASQRERWLEMFARGYYQGRSGQMYVVPREGEFITQTDPLYRFMHGSPWSYDTRIPILFYGAPFVRPGQFTNPVHQQDVMPTLAAMLGTTPPSTVTGRVLQDALSNVVIGKAADRPRVMALFVFDAMRVDYFDKHADVMPTITRMRREGAWFSQAEINYLPTVTSVGHATVGTGTDPRIHGQAANNLFSRVTGKPQQAYDGLDPRELMTLTLGDVWNLDTNGRAIIIGQGGAIRAVAGLVGHGACIVNGKPVLVASYSTSGEGGWETNPTCYRMPDYLKTIVPKTYWSEVSGKWMGHDITTPTSFRASSLFQRFEADALLSVLEHEAIGADDVTDLVLVNMKGPDYNAHAYGPESAELKEALAELDRQMTKVLAALERKAGAGRFVVAITADHGMPPEPKEPTGRHFPAEVIGAIHKRFDPEGKIVQYFDDPAGLQIYMDTERMRTLGVAPKQVAQFLESMGFIVAAFTEEEVRAASRALAR